MTAALKSRADRYGHGRELRARIPREAHAELHGSRDRDAVAILAESDPERVAELLPRRYKLMTADAFGFLRGAAAVMAADLAHQPIAGAPVQACGDCHLMNFGAFNSPEDNILFDINDFDETLPGVDFTVDLKRLAASVAVAARAANMSDKRARSLAAGAVTAYREHMFALMDLSPLEIWHSRIDLEQQLKHIESPELRRSLSTLIRHAQHRGLDKDDNFPHLVTGGEPRIADKPPTIFHISPKTVGGRRIDFARGFALYRETLTPDRTVLLDRYRLMDIAFKAVGVGSVGTICVVGLFLSGDHEPLFLQVKQAQRSVLERLSDKLAYQGPQGRRVVEGQRMMQAASDIFLGWTSDEPLRLEFYVRVLKNRRLGAVSDLAEQEALSEYARLCGRTLARSHARTGDPAVIAGYMGRNDAFDDALASFAMAYADQTIKDHAALVKAKGGAKAEAPPKAAKPAAEVDCEAGAEVESLSALRPERFGQALDGFAPRTTVLAIPPEGPRLASPSAPRLDPGRSRAHKFTRANDFMDLRPPLRNFDRPRLSESQSRATSVARAGKPRLISRPLRFGPRRGGKPAESEGFISPSETNGFATRA